LLDVAKQFSFSYRLAEPQEESQGIDGFINVIPVSIKPISYEIKKSLSEKILVSIIFYKKLKDGIKISYNENVFL